MKALIGFLEFPVKNETVRDLMGHYSQTEINRFENERGFTLVEVIAVMVILGVLSTLAIPRYIDLEISTKKKAIEKAISEINSRENLIWAKQKISITGYDDDQKIRDAINYDLGSDYLWAVGPGKLGGTIEFKGLSADLSRIPSTPSQPAVWSR